MKVSVTVGMHPKSTIHYRPVVLEDLHVMLQDPKIKAVGEIGLDYI